MTPGSTDEIIGWLLGTGHYDCLDEEGRPLGEQASIVYDHVERREEVRSFNDARDVTGLPCNIAALMQLQGEWPALLGALRGFAPDQPATVGRAFLRANASTRLAPLLHLRSGAPPTRAAAALYKVCLGFNELLAAMLIEENVDADAPMPDDTAFFTFVDERGFLIGDAQVCAGTRAQIRKVWAALFEDGASGSVEGYSDTWFSDAARACRELEALAACAAGAARVSVASGEPASPIATQLYTAATVPRLVEALRQAPAAAVMHPTLLFASNAVPESLRNLIEAIAAKGDVDEALVSAAQHPARDLMRALGRDDYALSDEAFTLACAIDG